MSAEDESGNDEARPFRAKSKEPLLQRAIPVSEDIAGYKFPRTPGVVVYRLDDRLFFANQSYVKARIREAVRGARSDRRPHTRRRRHDPRRRRRARGAPRHHDHPGGRRHRVARGTHEDAVTQRLEDAGIARTIGPEFFHPTVQAAVDASLAATAGTAAASQSPTGIPPATPT